MRPFSSGKVLILKILKIGAAVCALGVACVLWEAYAFQRTTWEGRIVEKQRHPQIGCQITVADEDMANKGIALGVSHTRRFYAKAEIGDTIRFGSYRNQLIRDDDIIATELQNDTRIYSLRIALMLFPLIIFVPSRLCGMVHATGTLIVISVVEAIVAVILVSNAGWWISEFTAAVSR